MKNADLSIGASSSNTIADGGIQGIDVKDDTLTGPGDKAFVDALTTLGIKHTFRLTEGRHEWTVWRNYLHEIAPLLFR